MFKQENLKKIYYILKTNHIKSLLVILFLTIITSLLELIGISLIVPLLGIFIKNEMPNYLNFISWIEDKSQNETLIIVLSLFILIQLSKFLISFLLLIKKSSFNWFLNANLAKKILSNYLKKDIIYFSKKHSSEIINNVKVESNYFSFGVVAPLIEIVIETFLLTGICLFLFFYNFKITLFLILFFLILVFFWNKYFNTYLSTLGKKRQFHSKKTIEKIQAGIGSIREIILYGIGNIFLKEYDQHNIEAANIGKKREIIISFPRLCLEFISILLIFLIFIILLNKKISLEEIIIVIGVFVFAIIRLIPSINKIIRAIQNIKFNNVVIETIYNESLNYDKYKNSEILSFRDPEFKFNSIELKDLTFKYKEAEKNILSNVNFKILENDKIGIIGKTGSGKTTLINIICGLIKSDSGQILLNGEDMHLENETKIWQKSLSYVSPDTYILDESIMFNVTFENEKLINIQKLNEVLDAVQLTEFVKEFPEGIYGKVGENGSKLSMGQKQRLGIARALYKDPKILILDEATSFLDDVTEQKILQKLFEYSNTKTIISISHRKSSLKNFNKIFEIKDNNVTKVDFN